MPARSQIHCWRLDAGFGLDGLGRALPPPLELHPMGGACEVWHLVDDFDWALWARDRVLLVSTGQARLVRRDREALVAAFGHPCDSPLLPTDLPEGRLRDVVLRCTSRPLQRRFACACERQAFALLDRLGKTIAQGWSERWELPGGEVPVGELCLSTLRGYGREFAAVRRLLNERASACPSGAAIFAGLAAGAFRPELPEVDIQLDDGSAPGECIRDGLSRLLANCWHNEQGVLDDVDPECLHHYRVNLRRARVLVAEGSAALGADLAEELAGCLKAIAGRTGPLRDLDVQLASASFYTSLLPKEQEHTLAGFVESLARQRGRQRGALRRYLRSQVHRRQRESLAQLLTARPCPASSYTLAELLSERIQYRSVRLVQSCRESGTVPTDDQLHRLRVGVKKLRYLIASCRGLFAGRSLQDWLRRLTGLQNALGHVHDLAVGRQWVAAYGAGLDDSAEAGEVQAIGVLVQALDERLVAGRADATRQLEVFLRDCRQRDPLVLPGKESGKP